jgi:Zn-dependent protease with chaperone function
MIFGYQALVLNLIAMIFLGMLAGAVIGSILTGILGRHLPHLDLRSRRWMLWLAAAFPLLAGFVTVVLSLLPEWLPESDMWLAGIIHWHHAYLFSPASWHGVFLLACLIVITACFVVSARKGVADSSRYRLLAQLGYAQKDGLTEVDAAVPMAFVIGFWRPTAFITTGLSRHISEQDAQIIRLHEQVHVRRRDPLKKALFRFLTAVYPAPVKRALEAEMDLVLEQAADESVLRHYPDKSAVAGALLRVARLQASFRTSVQASTGACHFVQHAIERRVQYLLGAHVSQPLPLVPFVAVLVLCLLGSAAGVDLLHHSLETFFLH